MSLDSMVIHKLIVDPETGLTPVEAANQIYYAERVQARKDWNVSHAAPEPGRGLDGRPLQRGKVVKQNA